MILGEVTPDGEAVIRLTVAGPSGAREDIEAVVDTGFTESLSLPRAVIARLALPPRGSADFLLADGTVVPLRAFRADVLWHGEVTGVFVAEADSAPLVGMALLRGSRLTVDCSMAVPSPLRASDDRRQRLPGPRPRGVGSLAGSVPLKGGR